jgi:dihydroorotate dehydrogenase electron transfer subunit
MISYRVAEIIDSRVENEKIKTIFFNFPCEMVPGQFFMIWVPGVDEVPMSVSYIKENVKGITFKRVGEATNSLFQMENGDRVGIRGPFGTGFKIMGNSILFVGGGTGIAMLAPAVEEAIRKKISSTIVIGATKRDELFFEKRFEKCGCNVYVSTDDGSCGQKGYATDIAERLLSEGCFDSILTCGPEIMMKKLHAISKGVNFQASLERYMKCGVGICGQCCIGEGLRVCVEGPVFDGSILGKIDDFGCFKRDSSGKRVSI